MDKRENLSKRIRFEVFKRDKFTCQYCGAKAPEVVLNVDHIDPVANGGGNDIVNLITSCFNCNSGKRDKVLSDNTVVEKQRRQLELLEERREQIELMFEWKKSLAEFDSEVVQMVVSYVNSKIEPFSLNENGVKSVAGWLKKFDISKILDGIDIAATQYIKYKDGKTEQESIETFIDKVGGVIVVNGMPPVKKKIAYIKGVGRKRFSYWDDRLASIILSNYLKELEIYYDEEQVLKDLENEVLRVTKEVKNWSEWRGLIEKWTSDIQGWDKPNEIPGKESHELRIQTVDELDGSAFYTACNILNSLNAIQHIASVFPFFDAKEFKVAFKGAILEYRKIAFETVYTKDRLDDEREFIDNFIANSRMLNSIRYTFESSQGYFGTLTILEPLIISVLTQSFLELRTITYGIPREQHSEVLNFCLKNIENFIEG